MGISHWVRDGAMSPAVGIEGLRFPSFIHLFIHAYMDSFTYEFISICTISINIFEANYVSNIMLTDCTSGFDPGMFSTHHSYLFSLPEKLLLTFKTWCPADWAAHLHHIESKNPKASFCLSQTLYLSVVTLVPLCKGAPYTTASLEIQENQHHQGVKDRWNVFCSLWVLPILFSLSCLYS